MYDESDDTVAINETASHSGHSTGQTANKETNLNESIDLVVQHMYLSSFSSVLCTNRTLFITDVASRAGRYGGIIVIPRYVYSPILIPKLILLYDFIVIDIIANNRSNNNYLRHFIIIR